MTTMTTLTRKEIASTRELRGANRQATATASSRSNNDLLQSGAPRTDTANREADSLEPAVTVAAIERWLANVGYSTSPKITPTPPPESTAVRDWLSHSTIAEAKLRFKDALEDAEEDEIPTPSDTVLSNALRAVQLIEAHCPQGLSSVAVLDVGIEATARGSNLNYISAECQENGEVLVMFNVRSYARYKDMDEAEREGFLKALLETLRY